MQQCQEHGAGLATLPEQHDALIYGAGDGKIGAIIGKGVAAGKKLKASFFSKTPALLRLKDAVVAAIKKRGYLRGLDGRRLYSRSPHSAVNLLLQSAGAVICKFWIVIAVKRYLDANGFSRGLDGDYYILGWIHDELQLSIRDQATAEKIGPLLVKAIADAGEELSIKCPLTGEFKIGANWAECH
jgi:DNA polymerase I-like protein with 3'-5' exonuclease and polymerase domains